MDEQVTRLTEAQRQALRLVFRHMETKEIARELGISPDGVTQRIKGAMRTLGVNKRRDAAQILAQAEGVSSYPRRVYPPRDIAIPPDYATVAPSTGSGWSSGSSSEVIKEEQAAFVAMPRSRSPLLPLPIGGVRPNDVSWSRRLAWIAGITIGTAIAFGGLVGGVEALTRLITS